MKSQEPQTRKTDNKVPAAENTPSYMNAKKPKKSEPVTRVQKDRVITKEDIPDPRFRYGVTLFFLVILLTIAAIYYGIINP